MTEIEKINRAHFRRLKRIDALYDTGRITYEEMVRREDQEGKRYTRELEATYDENVLE